MEKMKIRCEHCSGFGYINQRLKFTDDSRCVSMKDECRMCDGKGYIEYVLFSEEEAKVIMKHCGLSI